ncbi:uncharacterized protein [Battus philenor]|uniref:uncharacterized protein n=1 Tax=Battus philenor TaxID=42288 RepID=UPI0035CF6D28
MNEKQTQNIGSEELAIEYQQEFGKDNQPIPIATIKADEYVAGEANSQITQILLNEHLAIIYMRCLLNIGPCNFEQSGEGYLNYWERTVPTDEEKEYAKEVISKMMNTYLETWDGLKALYNPQGKHQ